jgi:hypothetical protein
MNRQLFTGTTGTQDSSRGLTHMQTKNSGVFLGLHRLRWQTSTAVVAAMFAMFAASYAPSAAAQTPGQLTFDTPEVAAKALSAAAKDEDSAAFAKIFGADHDKLGSGDPVEDKKDLDDFSAATQESTDLVQVDATTYTVTVGKDAWPMPIPLVQKEGKWFFDTPAGLEELLTRRIGDNELAAIETCRAYALAQWEYYTQGDWDKDGIAEYAQRIISSPGKHDGLYWESEEGEPQSPLGALVAEARAEGYGPKAVTPVATGKSGTDKEDADIPRAPYHGYHYKILTAQGSHAPGGKFSYIINGNMIAGYALVAYPDKWSNSGVMTFIVNQQGRVYQKNLGADTEKVAAALLSYDPDSSWTLVEEDPTEKAAAEPAPQQ